MLSCTRINRTAIESAHIQHVARVKPAQNKNTKESIELIKKSRSWQMKNKIAKTCILDIFSFSQRSILSCVLRTRETSLSWANASVKLEKSSRLKSRLFNRGKIDGNVVVSDIRCMLWKWTCSLPWQKIELKTASILKGSQKSCCSSSINLKKKNSQHRFKKRKRIR